MKGVLKIIMGALLAIILSNDGQTAEPVPMISIEGAIGPALAAHVAEGLSAAAERNTRLVLIRLDTPGGLDSAMRRINAAILSSPVPVVCWVGPAGARAASAGTYILYACHLSLMAPGTNLGAATPIALGQTLEGPAKDKAVNDAAAYIRSLANLRGRNAEWADQAVREAKSLAAAQAAELHVVDGLAESPQDVLSVVHGRTVTINGQTREIHSRGLMVEPQVPSLRTRVLSIITTPEVAYLLMLAGIYGILFELMNPGVVFPGVIGAISLLLGLYALNLLPVNYAGIGLVLLGIGLMAAEAFVPSFGILGMGGAVAFALGSLMVFDTGVPGYRLPFGVVIGATLVTAAVAIAGLAAAIRSRHGRAVSGGEALIGSTGTVEDWRAGKGRVHLCGETWEAIGHAALVKGQAIRVVGREGLILIVERIDTEARS